VLAADRGKVLEVTGAGPLVITLPTGLGTGFDCEINNISGATVTLSAGAGATLVSRAGLSGVSIQYASVYLRTRTATQWIASGDLN